MGGRVSNDVPLREVSPPAWSGSDPAPLTAPIAGQSTHVQRAQQRRGPYVPLSVTPRPFPGIPGWNQDRSSQAAGEGTGSGSWDSRPTCHSPPGTPSPGQGTSPSRSGPHNTVPCAPWVLPHDRHMETWGRSVTGQSRRSKDWVRVPWAPPSRRTPHGPERPSHSAWASRAVPLPLQCRRWGLAAHPRRGYMLSPRATLSLSLLRKVGLRFVNLPGFPDTCLPSPCTMAALSGRASPCHAW